MVTRVTDLGVADLLLHQHATVERGPRHLVLPLGGAVLGVEGERVPVQSAILVFMKPFAALAVINPVRCVVKSRITVVKPCGGSEIETASVSPG